MLVLILPLAMGLGVALLFCGLWLADRASWQDKRAALLRRFGGQTAKLAAVVDPRPSLRREAPTPWWQRALPARQRRDLAEFCQEMRGITQALFGVVVVFALLVLNVGFGANLLLTLVIGLLAAAAIWAIWAKARRSKRLQQIDEAIPEALDMIVRTLRVGLPISTAIQSVGAELAGPIAAEFSQTAERISYGQPAAAALREMAERAHNLSLRYLAAAVSIQAATGGNLADVLERLSAVARGHQQMQRKIRSITAEAKWSGRFLSMFPLLASAAILAINPNYFAAIADQPFFPYLLALVGALLVANMLFMRWLVNIE